MTRAVIDTNVLVSGLLSPSGNEALVLLAIHQHLVHPCLSEAIVAEYTGVLARPKFAFSQDQISALMAMLQQHGEWFYPTASFVVSPDPTDSKFLHCALAADADFLVTGNKRDFPDAPYGSLRVINAGELLDHITLDV